MSNYNSNYEIAQAISERIGAEPIPFDSVYEICLQIYNELGGEPEQFDSVYEILLGILPLVGGGIASKVIDDHSIATDKTWSSSKINSEISAISGTANPEIEGKQTEDFTFVNSLPAEGEDGQQVIIKGENSDTLYKYTSGAWAEQTPDATKLYFDTEHEALYSYVTADHQFAPVSMVNTIVVGSNLNSNAALKALKTPGVYSVVQRLHNATKGDYVKNWTLYVESVDYEEYDRSDSIYQRLVSNYTIQKRTWSATRATNDGWSSFSTYYAGEIKDTTTSKYYTWSSSKLNTELGAKQNTLTAGTGISISGDTISCTVQPTPALEAGDNIAIEDNKINAKGYFSDYEPKTVLKSIDDIIAESGVPVGQSLGLKISGAAGATTYTYTDNFGGAFAQIVQMGILPGVGATYQTVNGKSGVISAIGNGTITFEETLDADNALTDEPVDYIVETKVSNSFVEGVIDEVEVDVTEYQIKLSGAAGATTYAWTCLQSAMWNIPTGVIMKIQNNRSAKIISADYANRTVTFDTTLDENSALNEELVLSISNKNVASGKYSHAEGGYIAGISLNTNTASGDASHAEGANTTASGLCSHAEGIGTTASGVTSHAEGNQTTASGQASHAEGNQTTASGQASHAEGNYSVASGDCSHAEGGNINGVVYKTEASGISSHAEGMGTEASGDCSHAEGVYTYTQNRGEHAEGRNNRSHQDDSSWNSHSAGNTIHSVGIGRGETSSGRGNGVNAFEIMQNGDIYVYGVGGYQGTDTHVQDASIKTLQAYIASLEARITALEGA